MHHAFQYPASAMAMWIVVMAVMKPSVTRPDLAKCAKLTSFAVQMGVPALRRVSYVTSTRTVLMALMRSIVVSCRFEENWFKHPYIYLYMYTHTHTHTHIQKELKCPNLDIDVMIILYISSCVSV
jgi:hypothetical protein